MTDIGDLCEYCPEFNCDRCIFGNPCYGCEDYDFDKDICKSNGGCGIEQEESEKTE